MGFNEVAWNMVLEQQENFKKLILPLKKHLGIDFGYMIVFNDGRYFQIIENLECLQKWVTNVETSHIFCARNVTTYFDEPYNFTIWPELPTTPAMEIYKEYGIWNGITVSKINKNYTELYWFTKQNAEDGWHKWFIRNKQFLLKYIGSFMNYKKELYIFEGHKNNSFKFDKSFVIELPESKYIKSELLTINRAMKLLPLAPLNGPLQINNFSQQQIKLISLICQGYTTKMAAQEMLIKPKTAEHYIERIKQKLGLHYKSEIVQLYKNSISNFYNI